MTIVVCFRYGVSDHVLTHKLVQYASQIPQSFDPIAPRKYTSFHLNFCSRKMLSRLIRVSSITKACTKFLIRLLKIISNFKRNLCKHDPLRLAKLPTGMFEL